MNLYKPNTGIPVVALIVCASFVFSCGGGSGYHDQRPSDDNCQANGYFECECGACIDAQDVCNGVPECSLHCNEKPSTDETGCSPSDNPEDPEDPEDSTACAQGEFECACGSCINEFYVCDGEPDCSWACGDDPSSDEQGCHSPEGSSCEYWEHTCSCGACVDREYICDGDPDCTWLCGEEPSSDEIGCEHAPSCEKDEFECDCGECIDKDYVCDGEPDCSWVCDEQQSSDEAGCEAPEGSHCEYWEFECGCGACLDKDYVCDGYPDCEWECGESPSSDELDCQEGPDDEVECHPTGRIECHGSSLYPMFECDDGTEYQDYANAYTCPCGCWTGASFCNNC